YPSPTRSRDCQPQANRRTALVEYPRPVAVRDAAGLCILRMDVDDRHAALQPQHVAVVAPGRVNRPSAVRRVPEERIATIILGKRRLIARQLLVEPQEPLVIDVELLTADERFPGLLL